MHEKPLVRWTIGPCLPEGTHCLQLSIKLWKSHYGDTCDYVVCANGFNPDVEIPVVRAENYRDTLPLLPQGPAWKLYPPRMRMNSHEIIIDNDLLLFEPHPMIEEFLNSNRTLTTEIYRRDYGSFDHLVPSDKLINSGIIGLPPGFDFEEKLRCVIRKVNLQEWQTHFCEQGAVAAVLENPLIISNQDILIGINPEAFRIDSYGVHFVGMNRGYSDWWGLFSGGYLL